MTNTNIQTPVNFATGVVYEGTNAHVLSSAAKAKGYTSAEWATLKEWNSKGRIVAKNQKGTPITKSRKDNTEEGVQIETFYTAFVFNRSQLQTAG